MFSNNIAQKKSFTLSEALLACAFSSLSQALFRLISAALTSGLCVSVAIETCDAIRFPYHISKAGMIISFAYISSMALFCNKLGFLPRYKKSGRKRRGPGIETYAFPVTYSTASPEASPLRHRIDLTKNHLQIRLHPKKTSAYPISRTCETINLRLCLRLRGSRIKQRVS